MRILAIDPGSKLGWATNQTGRLEWSTEDFTIKNGESSGNRWRRFGEWLNEAAGQAPVVTFSDGTTHEEAQRVARQLRDRSQGIFLPKGATLLMDRKVDLVVYERATFMPKARAAAEIAGGFTTRLEEHCERHGIALQPVAVSTLKKYATGKGNSGKEAMIWAARHKVDQYMHSNAMSGTVIPLSEHEADALWLYWYAMEHFAKEER